jgi:DNA-binding transcriptional regulator YdaS (Cro superfamily)
MAELARRMGVQRQAVHRWKTTGRVPAHHARTMESVSGVPRKQIRPDIFG